MPDLRQVVKIRLMHILSRWFLIGIVFFLLSPVMLLCSGPAWAQGTPSPQAPGEEAHGPPYAKQRPKRVPRDLARRASLDSRLGGLK